MVFNATFSNISVISWRSVVEWGRVMVFNATFSNISVISWQSVVKGVGLWCLMPLSAIFQLYHGSLLLKG
jgi:hypothetical protein